MAGGSHDAACNGIGVVVRFGQGMGVEFQDSHGKL